MLLTLLISLLFSFNAYSQLTWTNNGTGTYVESGTSIERTDTLGGTYQSFHANELETDTSNVFLEFEMTSVGAGSAQVLIGLDVVPYSTGSGAGSFTAIEHRLYFLANNTFLIQSNGGGPTQGATAYSDGDVFKMIVSGTTISYYRNDVLIISGLMTAFTTDVRLSGTGINEFNITNINYSASPSGPIPPPVNETGRLKDSDFQSETQLTGAGATAADLLNDTKIYITSVSKTLDDAINDGDVGSTNDATITPLAGVNKARMCSFRGSGGASASNETGDCLDTVVDNSTGNYTYNFNGGYWGLFPNCTCTVVNSTTSGATVRNCQIINTSTTSLQVLTKDDNGNLVDYAQSIICHGVAP